MSYLVDANVLSEPTRPSPSAKVLAWLRKNERDLVVDPIIVGEIRFGIHLLAAGRRRRRLEEWFDGGIVRLRCLPWELATGLRWARLLADLRASGQSMPIKDSLIAATALEASRSSRMTRARLQEGARQGRRSVRMIPAEV